MKKKRIAAWLLLIAAFAVTLPLLLEGPRMITSYDRDPRLTMSEAEVRSCLAKLSKELDAVETKQVYPLEQALRIEADTDFLVVNAKDDYADYLSAESGDEGPMIYWEINRVQMRSASLRERFMPRSLLEDYWELYVKNARSMMNFRAYPERSYLDSRFTPRVTFAVMLVLLAAFLELLPYWGRFRKLFSTATLKYTGMFIATAVSLCTTPAVAQVFITKVVKDQQANEQVENPDAPDSLHKTEVPPPRFEAKQESFAAMRQTQNGADRQYLTSVYWNFRKRWSFVFINQFRQGLDTGGDLEVPALGVRYRFSSRSSLTLASGPEGDNTKLTDDKWRRKSETTFVIFGYNSPAKSKLRLNFVSINRFPVETDSDYSGAHRHITSIRAGPIPNWLAYQSEIKWVGRDMKENYQGANVKVGQIFKGWLKRWLGGFYAYVYRDFSNYLNVQPSWNLRLGLTESFAVQ